MVTGLNWSLATEAYDGAYLNRLLILLKSRKRFVTAVAIGMMLITGTNSLFEIPQYVSEYALQVDPYNMGKSVGSQLLFSNDLMSGNAMVNTATALLRSDLFLKNLADAIQSSVTKDELVIVSSVGFREKFNFALHRMGLKNENLFKKKDVSKLNSAELGVLLGSMLEIFPNVSERILLLKVKSYHPQTAYLINKSVMTAYTETRAALNKKQLETSLGFYMGQVKSAREKLDGAEDMVTQFLRAYPMLASDTTRLSFLSDFSALQASALRLRQEIEINEQLYNYYKHKYVSFEKDSDSNMDLLNRYKQELVELKYKMQVYKEKGYEDTSGGIQKLKDQITRVEALIKNNSVALQSGSGKSIVSFSYLERTSDRLQDIQDAIRVAKVNLQIIEENIEKRRPQVNTILQQTITLQGLRREAEIAAGSFAEAAKKLQMAKSRAEGEETVIAAMNEPTLPGRSIGLPTSKKMLFSFLIGLAIAVSIVLLKETFSPKILDRQTVEQMGFKYAGMLDHQIANQAEILSGLGCLDDIKAGKGPKIILCASPKETIGVQQVNILSRYLSKSKRKSLMIVVSDSVIPSDYQITDDMGYARIYKQPDGFEDLVQITDPDTFSSMRSLLDQFGSKYQVVFIFVSDPTSNLGYHMAQRVAKQLLLIGEMGEHSAQDYQRLVHGFSNGSEIYVVLSPPIAVPTSLRLPKFFDRSERKGGGGDSSPPPGETADTLPEGEEGAQPSTKIAV